MNHTTPPQQFAKNKTVMEQRSAGVGGGGRLIIYLCFNGGKPELHHHYEAMSHKSLFI